MGFATRSSGGFVIALAAALAACPKAMPQSASDPLRVDVSLGDGGFSPAVFSTTQGRRTTIVFTRARADCPSLAFPDLAITLALPRDEPTSVSVPTNEIRTLSFACASGEPKGAVIVGPPPPDKF